MFLITGLSSCSKDEAPGPAPASTVAATATSAKAQAWFATQRGAATSRTTGGTQPAINWEQAIYSGEYVIAPFVDTANPFAEVKKYGYRFLVVRIAADSSCTGRIAELIVDGRPAGLAQAAQQALTGTKPFLAGYSPGSVEGLTGSLFVYSPAYEYENGLAYQAGAVSSPIKRASQK